ncbi:hypothetical protein JQS43_13895 [Natronosporangium hydrolyticum]|uniref:DUF2231 domain-containing protein n=1 Tax=Natronosporangium hydrolyticum TaxID=2811111 RepID=A0A895Y5W6_9ACTN|nr:DUF2231 domain-containing protein [Natronosporangium hydrolyticum]QSB12781.1 hypothetical protein JQS43_13895 [Natronosporangium hydrolyticum]
MFEEFMDIPAHPLLVHAPVVFVPLLALLAIAYAFVPVIRPHTRWVLGALAVVTPISALFAKLSGDAFFDRLDEAGRITEGFYPTLEEHQALGNMTAFTTAILGLATLALVLFVVPRRSAAALEPGGGAQPLLLLGLRVLTVLAALASLYYVVRTGDTGAKAVWTGY